ncbi:MAG: 6-phosphofructokinase, partial [Deltaproteobacteria bacterium]|nr:6-phosphofructokinase [Deltaproteobacteria bacterium]
KPVVRLQQIVDILVGAMVKRLSYGRHDGVAVLAEGLVEHLDPKDLEELEDVERDEHDNIRIAEVNIGTILKYQVQKSLKDFGIKATIVAKNIGYELRCADPIPYDMEYTRDLGFCAAEYLFNDGNAAMVSIQSGRFVPLHFKNIIDPKTNRTRVRMVDVGSEYYAIARQYMIRLNESDFTDPYELAKYAATCGMSLKEFRARFEYLVKSEKIHEAIEEKRLLEGAGDGVRDGTVDGQH